MSFDLFNFGYACFQLPRIAPVCFCVLCPFPVSRHLNRALQVLGGLHICGLKEHRDNPKTFCLSDIDARIVTASVSPSAETRLVNDSVVLAYLHSALQFCVVTRCGRTGMTGCLPATRRSLLRHASSHGLECFDLDANPRQCKHIPRDRVQVHTRAGARTRFPTRRRHRDRSHFSSLDACLLLYRHHSSRSTENGSLLAEIAFLPPPCAIVRCCPQFCPYPTTSARCCLPTPNAPVWDALYIILRIREWFIPVSNRTLTRRTTMLRRRRSQRLHEPSGSRVC